MPPLFGRTIAYASSPPDKERDSKVSKVRKDCRDWRDWKPPPDLSLKGREGRPRARESGFRSLESIQDGRRRKQRDRKDKRRGRTRVAREWRESG